MQENNNHLNLNNALVQEGPVDLAAEAKVLQGLFNRVDQIMAKPLYQDNSVSNNPNEAVPKTQQAIETNALNSEDQVL